MAASRSLIFVLVVTWAFAQKQCGTDPQAPLCDNTETCCKDSPSCTGACTECCVKQNTFCVAPRGGFTTSTCCGRWTVGCTVGSVGCCDPARSWQLLDDASKHHSTKSSSLRKPHARASMAAVPPVPSIPGAPQPSVSSTAYALFTKSLKDGLSCLTIQSSTGTVTARHPVTGPAAEYFKLFYGESTRLFPFDAAAKRFLIADLDRTGVSTTALVLYSIDATTGSSTKTAVQGCRNEYPLGVSWDRASGALIISSNTATTVHACSINVDTGAGSALPDTARGSDESSPTYYAGYHTVAHNSTLIRVGHQKVSAGVGSGVGVTSPGTQTSWTAQSAAPQHGTAASAVIHDEGYYLFLSPKAVDGSLDVVKWDATSGPSLFANLTNAHHPSMPMGGGILGYVGDAIHGNAYAALTVARNPSPVPGLTDKWSVSTIDLITGKLTQAALSPQPSFLGAETVSLSGFGLVAEAA